MLAESSVECGLDDPVLVVPWSDAVGSTRFVDLRENPYDLDHIPEAEQHPQLMQALRALNASRSPVFTAKCDAWPMDSDELEASQLMLHLPPADAACGFISYIDLIFRERTLFVSLHHQQQRLDRLGRLLEPLDQPYAHAESVLRPALVDLTAPQEGFAVTLYLKAVGPDISQAYEHWSRALAAVVPVLRGKELSS